MKTSRVSRSYSLHVAALDELWLYDSRHGLSPERIADRDGVSAERVRRGIGRAKGAERMPRSVDEDDVHEDD